MKHRTVRTGPAVAVTAALLAGVWSVPVWSDRPAVPAISVTATPELRAAGDEPEPADSGGYDVDVTVAGAGDGDPVSVEMWSGDRWAPETKGETDADGAARLTVSGGAFGRVVAEVDGSRMVQNFDTGTAGPELAASDELDDLGSLWLSVPQPTDGDGASCTMSGDAGARVRQGFLRLTVAEDPGRRCPSDPSLPVLVNGHLVLRVPISYGTVAARIRFPVGRSVVGQFWLQPGDPGQRWVMDRRHEGVVVAETRGTGEAPRLGTSVNTVVDGEVRAAQQLAPPTTAPVDGRFHVYSVTWSPEGLTFAVDGDVVREAPGVSPAPPLTIGLAVRPLQRRLPSGGQRRSMDVDWVRAWGTT